MAMVCSGWSTRIGAVLVVLATLSVPACVRPAHPLVGEWQIDDRIPVGAMGLLPFKDGRIAFGKDYMESGGERLQARFEVQGEIVTVTAVGQTGSIKFRVKDNTRMAMGFLWGEVPFNRIH